MDPTGLRSENEVGQGLLYDDEHETYYSKTDNNIKDDVKIEITRSSGSKYYNDTLEVKYKDIVLDRTSVQSEADHPKLNSGPERYVGMTLPGGDYTGTLLNFSSSYLNAIKLENNNWDLGSRADAVFIHPNVITNADMREKRETATPPESNGPFSQPFSLGCQIPTLKEFNEMTNTIKSLGFKYGDGKDFKSGSAANIKGDKIAVRIRNYGESELERIINFKET